MASELDLSTLEPVRGAADIMAGLQRLLLGLAERAGSEPGPPENETPEEGAALFGAELRCIVEDTIGPAIERLEGLIADWTPQPDRPEPEPEV